MVQVNSAYSESQNPSIALTAIAWSGPPLLLGPCGGRVRVRLGNDCEIGAPSQTSDVRLPLIDCSDTDNSAAKKIYSALCDRPRPSPLLLVSQSSSFSFSIFDR